MARKKVDESILKNFGGDRKRATAGLKKLKTERPEAFKALGEVRKGTVSQKQFQQGLKRPEGFTTTNVRTGQRSDQFGQGLKPSAPRIGQVRTPISPQQVGGRTEADIRQRQRAVGLGAERQERRTGQLAAPRPTVGQALTGQAPRVGVTQQEAQISRAAPTQDKRLTDFVTQQQATLESASPSARAKLESQLQKDQGTIEQINQIQDEATRDRLIQGLTERKITARGINNQITNAINAQRRRQVTEFEIDGQRVTSLEEAEGLVESNREGLQSRLRDANQRVLEAKTAEQADKFRANVRDIEEQMGDLEGQFERSKEIFKIQSDRQISNQRKNISNMKQNLGFLQGTEGFAKSVNALDAADENITRQKDILGEMKQLNRLQRQGAQASFEQRMRDLDQSLTDNFEKTQLDAITQLNRLEGQFKGGQIDRGQLDQEIKSLKSQIAFDTVDVLENHASIAKQDLDFFEQDIKRQVAAQQAQQAQQAQEKTIDVGISNQVGDGVARNKFGAPVTDQFGNAIRFDATKPVQTVLKNADGSTTVLFKDGTHETKQFGMPLDVSEEVVASFAENVRRGVVDFESGVPKALQSEVSVALSKLEPSKVGGGKRFLTAGAGKVFDTEIGKFVPPDAVSAAGVSKGDVGDFSVSGGSTQNIPDALNNPGNIKSGGSGDEFAARDKDGNLILSSRGEGNFLTFDTPEAGFQALMSDLKAKQTGRTRTALTPQSSLLEFAKIYATAGQSYADNIAREAGVSINTPIGEIPTFDFARGVSKAEGFTGQVSEQAITQPTETGFSQFTDEQVALGAIPVQLRNTEKEQKRFLEGINLGLSEGLTPQQVADRLIGYKINDEKNQGFADNLRSAMFQIKGEGAQVVPQQASRLINQGKNGQAVRLVEKNVLGKQISLEATSKNATQRVNELVKKLESSKGAVGPISARLQKPINNFFTSEELTDISNRMTQISSKVRNELAGANVTPSEEIAIEAILLKPTDSLEVALTKLENVKREPLREYNNIRTSKGLPELDEVQLFNDRSRVKLYEGQVIQKSVSPDALNTGLSDQDIINSLSGIE